MRLYFLTGRCNKTKLQSFQPIFHHTLLVSVLCQQLLKLLYRLTIKLKGLFYLFDHFLPNHSILEYIWKDWVAAPNSGHFSSTDDYLHAIMLYIEAYPYYYPLHSFLNFTLTIGSCFLFAWCVCKTGNGRGSPLGTENYEDALQPNGAQNIKRMHARHSFHGSHTASCAVQVDAREIAFPTFINQSSVDLR